MMKTEVGDLIGSQRGAVMGAAELWIFFFHLWINLTDIEIMQFMRRIGFVGVDFFLLLSGMGLIYAVEKRSTMQFYIHRLERVFLPFALMGLLFKFLKDWSWGEFLKNVLCINFYVKHILSFLWFVPAILTLYLLFPLYYRYFRRSESKGRMTLAAILVWLAASLLAANIPVLRAYFDRTWMFLFTNRIPIFLTGVYLGWRLRERPAAFSGWSWVACIAVFVLSAYLMNLVYFQKVYLIVPESFCFLPAYLMTISGVPLTAKGFQLLKRHGGKLGGMVVYIFSLIGSVSLEFYLVHQDLGGKVQELASGRFHPVVIDILTFLSSLAAAMALAAVCKYLRRGFALLQKPRETAA